MGAICSGAVRRFVSLRFQLILFTMAGLFDAQLRLQAWKAPTGAAVGWSFLFFWKLFGGEKRPHEYLKQLQLDRDSSTEVFIPHNLHQKKYINGVFAKDFLKFFP